MSRNYVFVVRSCATKYCVNTVRASSATVATNGITVLTVISASFTLPARVCLS